MTFVVNIEDRTDPGSPYYTVATDKQEEVEALEATAQRKGFDAVVRHSDSFGSTISWLEQQ